VVVDADRHERVSARHAVTCRDAIGGCSRRSRRHRSGSPARACARQGVVTRRAAAAAPVLPSAVARRMRVADALRSAGSRRRCPGPW
jgi:hypothetical protein